MFVLFCCNTTMVMMMMMMMTIIIVIIVDCYLECRGVEPASSIFIPEVEVSCFCHIR
jgi:hypothetical protein